jgi:proteasome lid subunit RPN8/RPN11
VLTVAVAAYEDIIVHASATLLREACGVLAGSRDGERSYVESAHPARNAAENPRVSYRIDPQAQLAMMDTIESAGREVVGFYHSHPVGPPAPSTRDLEEAAWDDHHYVVVSMAGSWPTVDAWRYTGRAFTSETVTIADATAAHRTPSTEP